MEDFFPFGEAVGDLKLPSKKHAFGKALMLNGTYSFYNTGYNELQVSRMTTSNYSNRYLEYTVKSKIILINDSSILSDALEFCCNVVSSYTLCQNYAVALNVNGFCGFACLLSWKSFIRLNEANL